MVLSYLVGFVIFLATIPLFLLWSAPQWWPLGELTWRFAILGVGVTAVIGHMFLGFLVGGRLDRARSERGKDKVSRTVFLS